MQGGLIERTARRLSHIITAPVQMVIRKAKRTFSADTFASKVLGDVRKGISTKKNKKERTLQDYFSFGRYYILKSVLYVVLLAAVILPVLYLKLLHPILVSNFFTKTMVINSQEMIGYTGKVELLSGKDGTLIFKGRMEDGRINGNGQLYTYEGALLYEGNFEMEAYSGEGELYYENTDVLCYKGSFLLNQYDGQGLLYDRQGNLIYKGEFKNGIYEGAGTLYFPGGQEKYVGTFAKGQMEGSGTLYDEEGNVIAEGVFENGQPSQKNAVMTDENGNVIYEGTINADGKYEGEGKLYEDGALA
ncbi:MAG: hypothetical protein K2O73_06605, partial [Lachnospiraceae bacterium]|nr:hypothetical protein [Lachnospiraceae bacterium]